MQKRIARTLHAAQTSVASFSMPQKIIAVIGIAVLLLGGFAFSQWASKPTLVPMYSNLSAEDAGAIVEQLDSQGVTYELADGGRSVLVPKADMYNLRLKMAGAGLPAGSESGGWKIVENNKLGSSQFEQQIAYQRALEGELSKTIKTMSGVKAATVHLALPAKDAFFKEENSAAKASVLLQVGPGVQLGGEQVQSVVHLVSSAIDDMKPENVTVVDQSGKLLNTTDGAGGVGGSRTKEIESGIRGDLQAALDRVVGVGNAIATVTADVDFANINEKQERFDDKSKAALSETKATEIYKGGAGTIGGIYGNELQPGQENVGVPGSDISSTKNNGEYSKENATRNNAVDKVTRERQIKGGEVKRMSVSVMVNSNAPTKVDLNTLREAVTAAAGINAERGDVLSVQQLPFDTAGAAEAKKMLEEAKKAEQQQQIMGFAKTGAIALAIIILAIVAFIISRKNRREEDVSFTEYEVVEEAPAPAPLEPERIEAPRERVQLPAVPEPDPTVTAMREDVAALVEKQPDEVAELLRGWLADRRS